jgi:hypothetical protein
MKNIISAALMLLLLCGRTALADEFSYVRCGADVPKALIGQHSSNENATNIEGRHQDIGLKDLGADLVSDDDDLWDISWRICGREYVLLVDSIVRDAIQFPSHSELAPEFVGLCKMNDKEMSDVVIAVLSPKEGADDFPATVAWKIDTKNKKFVKIAVAGLMCPKMGIITDDGGL